MSKIRIFIGVNDMGLDYNEANLSNSNLILLLLHSNANCDMFIQNTRQAV